MSNSKWFKLKKGVAHAGTPRDSVFLRPGVFLCPWCFHAGRKKRYKNLWLMVLHAYSHEQKKLLGGDVSE